VLEPLSASQLAQTLPPLPKGQAAARGVSGEAPLPGVRRDVAAFSAEALRLLADEQRACAAAPT
jgi:hypothetical protein